MASSSNFIVIAEKVVAALVTASIFGAVTPVLDLAPAADLADLSTMRVTVCPVSEKKERITRGGIQRKTYGIDVCVQKKYDTPNSATIDPLVVMCEAAADLFVLAGNLAGFTQATCTSAELDPIMATEHADEWRAFTTVIKLEFEVNE